MRNLRKLYLISPNEQILYGFVGFLTFFVGLGIQTFIVIKTVTTSDVDSSMGYEPFLTNPVVKQALYSFAVISTIGFLFIFSASILYTHRVFGSVHAVKMRLRQILDNQPATKIVPRKYDQVNELVELTNELVERYNK